MMQGPGYQIRGLCCWWWGQAQMVIRAAPRLSGRGQREATVGNRGWACRRGCGGRIPKPVPLLLILMQQQCQKHTLLTPGSGREHHLTPRFCWGPIFHCAEPRAAGTIPWPRDGSGLPGPRSSESLYHLPSLPSLGGLLPILLPPQVPMDAAARLYWVGTASSGFGHVCGRTCQEPCSR